MTVHALMDFLILMDNVLRFVFTPSYYWAVHHLSFKIAVKAHLCKCWPVERIWIIYVKRYYDFAYKYQDLCLKIESLMYKL